MTSGVLSVSAGAESTCALEADGAAKCWGDNFYGQLGDGTFLYRPRPTNVMTLPLGIQAVDLGIDHTCAVLPSGGVNCWGRNDKGQLGIGIGPLQQSLPVQVTGLTGGAVGIAAGSDHTCVRMETGAVKCWGYNFSGQLGIGSNAAVDQPTDVTALGTAGLEIAAGGDHTCALVSGGGVKCWGSNSYGQLGDQTTQSRNIPVDVSGLSSGVLAVTGGFSHTCALMTGGGVKCWGDNFYGQLGDGTTTSKNEPVDVIGLGGSAVGVSAGADFSCALLSTGTVKCWGNNFEGQLGNGTTQYSLSPVTVNGLPGQITAIASGDFHTCALSQEGGLSCWGYNGDGQLGIGTYTNSPVAVAVPGMSSGILAVRASYRHTCAIAAGGQLKCWGHDRYGQLGQGTEYIRTTPVYVIDALPTDYLFLPSVRR